jgi:MFS family permease
LKILNKISICNGSGPFIYSITDLNPTPNAKSAPESSYLALFNKSLIITTLILFVYWFNTILIYYGLIFTNVAIVSNPYINGIIIALMEIISMIFTSLFGNRFKRKKVVFLSMLITRSGLYFISAFSYFYPNSAIVIIPFAITKLGLSFEFYYLYLCTGELYPTYCRSVAFGLCGIVGRFGGVAQARIVSFANDYGIQPNLIIATVGCLSFISVWVMRETANDEFKEVEEGEREGNKGD